MMANDPWEVVSTEPMKEDSQWAVDSISPIAEKKPSALERGWKLATERREPLPGTKPGSIGAIGTSVGNILGRNLAGVGQMVAHPIESVKGIGSQVKESEQLMAGVPHEPGPTEQRIQQFREEYAENPAKALENATGDILAMYAAGKITGLATKGVAKVLPKVKEIAIDKPIETGRAIIKNVTNTTPSDVALAVKKASKANELKVDRAADINARRAETHTERVETVRAQNESARAAHEAATREYEAAKAQGEEVKKAAQETQTKRGQLARQINEQSARLVERVKNIKASTKARIDNAYAEIRKATGTRVDPATGGTVPAITVPRETLANAVQTAESKLKGSSESIKIFRDILSKAPEEEPESIPYQGANISKGHPLYEVLAQMNAEGAPEIPPADFSQLQGYYSELGTQLSKGTLPGDVYTAMKGLQADIGKLMKSVADKGKVGAKLTATQVLYHDYMETFNESSGPNHSGSPIASVLDAKDPAYAIKPLTAEETAARVRNALARFDPSPTGQGGAAQLYDNFRSITRQFDSLKEPKGVAKAIEPPKPFTPKPEPPARPPIKPKLTQYGEKELSTLKRENALEAARKMKKSKSMIVNSLAAFDMIRSGILGEWSHVALDVAARVLYSAGKQGIAEALQHPEILSRLEKITPEDYAAISKLPPDQRTAFIGQMKPVIEAAKAKGITLDPRLVGIVQGAGTLAGAPKKGVANALQPAQ